MFAFVWLASLASPPAQHVARREPNLRYRDKLGRRLEQPLDGVHHRDVLHDGEEQLPRLHALFRRPAQD